MGKLTGILFIATMFALGLACNRDPIWPKEFAWNSAGAIPGYHCTHILERSDPHTWHDNFFCQKAGKGINNIGMRWSYAGKYYCFINFLWDSLVVVYLFLIENSLKYTQF